MRRYWFNLLALCLIAVGAFFSYWSGWDDSPAVDEVPHIGAGYSYTEKADGRLNPEHPPLAKVLAGVGLQFINPSNKVFETGYWTTDVNGQWYFGRTLLYHTENNPSLMLRAARLPMMLFYIGAAIIIFIWTRRLFGNWAALLATGLFAFSPTVMAHGKFVTTDMAALFGLLLASFFFMRYVESPSKKSFFLAAIALGIAELTKFSLVLLIPFFIGVAMVRRYKQKNNSLQPHPVIASTILIIVLAYFMVVIPWYTWHVWNYPASRQTSDTQEILSSYPVRSVANTITWATKIGPLRPLAHYATGVVMVSQRSFGGNYTYFLGDIHSGARPIYFPFVYFVKEPLAFWLLACLAGAFSVYRAGQRKRVPVSVPADVWLMLAWLAIYWASSVGSNLNIGVRHLMPIYGFTYILVAGGVASLGRLIHHRTPGLGYRAWHWILAATIVWYGYANIATYPYYLTFFNSSVGGPENAYRYVVDSNLDWGQDLKRLRVWVEENKIDKINLDFFGWADVGYHFGDRAQLTTSRDLPNLDAFLQKNPQGGYLAVSATFYMNSRGTPEASYAWLDEFEPIAKIGNSIFVWQIRPQN